METTNVKKRNKLVRKIGMTLATPLVIPVAFAFMMAEYLYQIWHEVDFSE